MKWSTRVECYLREYLCKDELKKDILSGLDDLDYLITPKTSHITDMPFGNYTPTSVVERIVENREKAKENIYKRLHQLSERLDRVERALNKLSDVEREVILWSYFSLEYNYDEDIAKYLRLSKYEFLNAKKSALHSIYDELNHKEEKEAPKKIYSFDFIPYKQERVASAY